jgi:dienelactone hydrolase
VRTEILTFEAEGAAFSGFLAMPDKPNGAGVLVAHGAEGQTDHERGSAHLLAERGYIALAIDYKNKGGNLSVEALSARSRALIADTKLLIAPMTSALAVLAGVPGVDPTRLAAIGYCLGGAGAFELAVTGAELKLAVGFHAVLPIYSPEACKAIKGAVLMLQGAVDPFVPDETRAQFEKNLNDAGVDWRLYIYGGAQHAFTKKHSTAANYPGVAYHEPTDKRSWRAMLDALEEAVGV